MTNDTVQADLLTGFCLVRGIHGYIYPDYQPPTRWEVADLLLNATHELLDGGDEVLTLDPGSPLGDAVVALITTVYPTEAVLCR